MQNYSRLALIILSICLLAIFPRCGNGYAANGLRDFQGVNNGGIKIDPYYLAGTSEEQDALKTYFTLLASVAEGSQEQFALVREITNSYMRQKEYGKQIKFLSSRLHQHPEDPYNAYYLLMTAYAYQQIEANPMAALYFEMILKNYPDLKVQGVSIHLACLKQLIALVENPQKKVWYYEELIARFEDQVDPASSYFMLAQAYEGIGEWDKAIKAYTRYLSYMGGDIPGFPDSTTYAKRLVDFSNSAKDWGFETLPSLVAAVKSALDAGSSTRLSQYHAKANFFLRTWEYEDVDHYDQGARRSGGNMIANLGNYMRMNRVRYADTVEMSSDGSEAYLRTWGWDQNVSTWYLYFRKIYFPPDPDIHGRWEWAGIYYGEKF